MAFWDMFRKWQYVSKSNVGLPVWSIQKDTQYITEAYNRSVWVYSCVSQISTAVSSVNFCLYRKGRGGRLIEIEEHPILKMLNDRVNPYMSSKDFFDLWSTYLAIEGKFYAEYINPVMPTEMFPIYPHFMKPIPSATEFIGGFEYNQNEVIKFLPNEILWSKFNDPLDIYQGLSPIRALSRTIDTENEAVDWNKATLQNSGVPAGVFSIQNPSPELQTKLREEWLNRYGGSKNAKIPLVLNADKATYQQIGLNTTDMDFINQRKMNRIEICSAFGVPSQIVGDPEGQTYSNYGEAQKAFWENTVIPRYLNMIITKLQQDLLPRYADNLIIRADLDKVGALKENQDMLATRTINLWKSGLVTRNEARYVLDYEDAENSDLFINDLSQVNQSQATDNPIKEIEPSITPVGWEYEEEDDDEEEEDSKENVKKKVKWIHSILNEE